MTLLDSLSQRASYLIQEAKKSPFFTNVSWNILGNMSAKAIGPIFSILVARMLLPKDYGVFGVAMASMALLNLTKDLGVSQAIIVTQDDDDWRSIQFTIQLIWGSILYLFIFFLSPLIADYYQMPHLSNILRLLGLGLFIAAIEDPLFTYYLRKQNYRLLFFRQIIPSIAFGTSALTLAFLGAGVYALVVGTLISNLTTTIFLLITTKWKPRMYLPYKQFLNLFQLGKHIIFQKFCGFLVLQADALIVGKNLGPVNVGLYRMGGSLSQILPHTLIPQMQQVSFTDMARHKDNIAYLNRRYSQFVYCTGAIILPISFAIVFLFPHIIPYILGDKWADVIPVAQIISVSLPTGMMVGINNDLSKILGFSHIYSYFSSIRSITTVTAVLIASQYSLYAMIVTWVIAGIISNLTNDYLFFKHQNIITRKRGHILMLAIILLWAAFVLYTIQF
jgi:O-antigen/teichoic acid export membrane protein